MIKSINSKHQATVDKFVKFDTKYNQLVDEGKEESKQGDNVYEKACELFSSLPKTEQNNLKSNGILGYFTN